MEKIPVQMFKKTIGFCGLFVLLHSAQAQFTFPVYEPFSEYPSGEGEELGTSSSSGVNWSSGSSPSGSSSIITTNAALAYPGFPADPNAPARGLRTDPTSTSVKYRHAPFTAQNSGTVYTSFLLSIPNLTNTANTVILTLSSSTSSSDAGGVSVWLNPAGQLLLAKNTETTTGPSTLYTSAATNTYALSPSNTYRVVMAYKFNTNSSTDDEVDLWLNPTVSLGSNGNVPAPTLSVTNGADVTSLASLFFYQAIGNLEFYVDEIRVATNWAGVTPTTTAPGNLYNVTGGGSGCPGDAFAVGLNGSDANVSYLLYTNGVSAGQSVSGGGSAISFGPESATAIYTVLASNTVSGDVGWMSGSTSISVLTGPVITGEPGSVTVVTNGLASFTVTATGSDLNYQWYKNGTGLADGGAVSGSQTATLTISPATPADAATSANGYYVVITNDCGLAATSSPVASLTLSAPASLVWQGGNPNTNWDLGITANWLNSSSALVVFNAGDSVTFNDNSTNPLVTLVGNGLAPGLITVQASQNYIFQGSGSIVGSGSLVMSGTGSLSISNANGFTGGTTISSGDVIVTDPDQMALGSGAVNLAGGTMEMARASGAANVGMGNNINVTANSTLQVDSSGSQSSETFAFNLFGGLTGSSGATLTINNPLNNSTSFDRMRLYGSFTNNCPIVLSTSGNQTQMAPYNAANDQVYNGVISGNGGQLVPRGAGVTILNGANTFNDSSVQAGGNGSSGYSLLLSGSNLGLGSDSVSSGGSVVSSPVGTGNVGIDVSLGNDTVFANGGAHTIANPIIYLSDSNAVTLSFIGSNSLTLAGPFTLSGADGTGNTNQTLQADNTGTTTISGIIGDNSLNCGLNVIGSNTLVLSAMNTYGGSTIVSNGTLQVNGEIGPGNVTVVGGTLGGSGTVTGPVAVESGATLAPGTSAIGTLTINGSLALNGNALFKINSSASPSNDEAVVSGALSVSGTGTLTVTNLGPALVAGDKFTLFNGPVANGNVLTVTGGGVSWTNNLALNGSIAVLSTSVLPTTPTNITLTSSSGSIALAWPYSYTGWLLQVQTNSLSTGLGSGWVTVAGSSATNRVILPVNPANPCVFYRLAYP